jgi:hypothetical protein
MIPRLADSIMRSCGSGEESFDALGTAEVPGAVEHNV